jgi:hypothetical protein
MGDLEATVHAVYDDDTVVHSGRRRDDPRRPEGSHLKE